MIYEFAPDRPQAGLARARAQAVRLGMPSKTNEGDRKVIRTRLSGGESVSGVAARIESAARQ